MTDAELAELLDAIVAEFAALEDAPTVVDLEALAAAIGQ
jgi:hypothetical protein